MIDTLDATIKQLLRSELDIEGHGIEVSFNRPNGQWASRRSGPAFNFFLYDVRENPTLRRHQWQQEQEQRSSPARAGAATFKRTPLMMDCFYLVTAWSGSDEQAQPAEEHMLLALVLRALARYPVLNPPFETVTRREVLAAPRYTAEDAQTTVAVEAFGRGQMTYAAEVQRRAWLNDPDLNPLAGAQVEVRARVAHHDVLTNPAEVWSALEAQMKAGFSYVVTLPLDPWKPLEAYRVIKQQARFGPTTYDPQRGALRPIDPARADVLYTIGGVIRNGDRVQQRDLQLQLLHGPASEYGEPAAIEWLNDDAPHRYTAQTSATGEYSFSDLPPGAYTLLICQPSGDTTVREFTLSPAGPTGFDFTI